MARRLVTYSQATSDAIGLLGRQISVERRSHKWTQAQLAERIGVTLPTIRAIENGAETASIGTVFEAAYLLGIPLVGASLDQDLRQTLEARDALLPSRVASLQDDDSDF
ncbi:helix-turn-helix transcriptional regulator [Mesorhizobium japonicum]|uniref:helix-turn-helix transcriptional regulator n=1 Tax=Mesorhizobium japonicum TaxID=2066070 RepID=UPI003B5AFFEA